MKAISYEQLITAALIRFKKVDLTDIHLLIDEYKKIGNVNNNLLDNLLEYIKYINNGQIVIPNNKALNDIPEEHDKTYEEIYKEYSTKNVMEFINSIDINLFKEKKYNTIENYKNKMLKSANILLISDNYEDFSSFNNYGFNNIDYFKSIIRADKYFKLHPEELDKYHIVLIGSQAVQNCSMDKEVDLESTLTTLSYKKKIFYSNIYHYSYPNEVVVYLYDNILNRDYNIVSKSNTSAINKIIECAFINNLLSIKTSKYTPIIEEIDPLLNCIPTNIKELKIKFLLLGYVNYNKEQILENTNIPVEFNEDSNRGLGKYVKDKLGDYEIIITSDTYSSNILGMNRESTEQCKDSKRPLVLLATYKIETMNAYDEEQKYTQVGYKVLLNYTFGGEFSPSYKHYSIKYYIKKCSENELIESIINCCIQLYAKVGIIKFQELPYNTNEQYTEEFNEYLEQFKNTSNKNIYSIQLFDKLLSNINIYLNNGYTANDIIIIENDNGYEIQRTYNAQIICRINISKYNTRNNLRIFSIQTLNNKGNLGKEEAVSLHTNVYNNITDIPKKANDKQISIIESLNKKISYILETSNKVKKKKKD